MNHNYGKVITEKTAARQIAADPRPVMIVDTCNFGNFVGLALSGESKLVCDTLCCLQEGITRKMFYLVAPQLVAIEFSRPGQFTDSAIKELSGPIQHWNSAVRTYNIIRELPNSFTTEKFYHEFDIEEASQLFGFFVNIGRRFLNQSIKVAASSRAKKWARQRGIDRKRPAKQGKDSFGDCEICGTALSFLKALRDSGVKEPAYFVSANIKDFTANGELHPDLQSEFDGVSLSYCQSITKAFGEIQNQRMKSTRGIKQSPSGQPTTSS